VNLSQVVSQHASKDGLSSPRCAMVSLDAYQ
jgi:hypothetical protein